MKTGPVQTLTKTSSIFRIQQEKKNERERERKKKSVGGFVLFFQVLWPPESPQPKERHGSLRFINSFIAGELKLVDRLFFQLTG